jgi:membrane fusion protein, multidrug efflux system
MTFRGFVLTLALVQAAPALATPVDCLIEPRAILKLVAPDKGPIAAIMVERGDRVAKGAALARLDDTVQQLQVLNAQTQKNADVGLRAAKARLSQRERELTRVKELRSRNVTPEAAVEEAQIAVDMARFDIEQAGINHHLAELDYDTAVALLERRKLVSPVDGLVIDVRAEPGEYAHEQRELVTLAVTDPLNVEAFVPATKFGAITVGQVYTVQQAEPLTGQFPATVRVVDQVFDPASNTFGIRLQIANPEGAIPAGTRCTIDLESPVNP